MDAQSIVDSTRVILIDATADGWPDPELLGYVSDFQSNTCMLKPDAYAVRAYIPLVAGTKQTLPDGTDEDLPRGIAVLDMGDNQASGLACVIVERELLDAENRFWPAATQEVAAQNWCADPRDPRRFDVTPPNDGTGFLECLYGAVPPALTDLADELVLGDQYKLAAECFVLHRAYSKNTKRQDLSKSAAYWSQYLNILGIKSTAQIAVAPKVSQQVGA